MIHAVALLTGFGGLLLELVWLRRYGLLLGNTAGAAAVVLGVYLSGLGVGGWLVGRAPRTPARTLRAAAWLYLLVAVLAVGSEATLREFTHLGGLPALGALVLIPGVATVAMGAAFPLLFGRLFDGGAGRRAAWYTGLLVGANLAGSVLGVILGANWLVPELGMLASAQIAAGAYGLAAVAAYGLHRRGPRPLPGGAILPAAPIPSLPPGTLGLAAASGFALLGFEVLLLRRLPFALEGFQPTLAGIVAAVLAWSTLGAAFGTPLLQRLAGGRAPVAALVLGVLACNLGLHEWLAPSLARWPVDSTLGMHARVALVASVAAGVPSFCLGAVVPLLLAPFVHPQTRAPLAGRLFAAQGFGALGGAVVTGHALPIVVPQAFFAVAPALCSLVAVGLAWRACGALGSVLLAAVVATAACLGVSGAGAPWAPSPPAAGSRYDHAGTYRHLAHATDATLTASVAYNRRNHSLILFTDEFRATETGPNTAYMRALGHLPLLLNPAVQRTAVIALGTGITFDALAAWREPRDIDVVEISAAVVGLASWFTADGPVPDGRAPGFERDSRAHLHVTDGRAYLARRAAASLDLITMEPLLPYAPGTLPLYTTEFYALARRALTEAGMLVQWVPTHAMPAAMFDTLLLTFAQAFPHTSVWLVDHSTLLVGSTTPHLASVDRLTARFDALDSPLRLALHETGLGGVEDVQVALVGTAVRARLEAVGARVVGDDRPFLERLPYWSGVERLGFLGTNLARLGEIAALEPPDGKWRTARVRRLSGLVHLANVPLGGEGELGRAALDLDAARTQAPHSVLLHREQTRALRALQEAQVVAAGPGMVAQRAATQHLARDPGSPLLWLALADDTPAARAAAVARARALDPEFTVTAPRAFGTFPPPTAPSPREDLGRLPAGEDLLTAATGDSPPAVALRGTFPTRVAHAAIAVGAVRSLAPAEAAAARQVLDPWSLPMLGAAIAARDGDVAAELLPLWRRDQSVPGAAADLVRGKPPARAALADALGGRRDAAAGGLLADLLVDPDEGVRVAASVALFRTAGDQVRYDPKADESAWRAAAAAVRALHNPAP